MINLVKIVPFLDTILSNEDFDNINSFENHNLKIQKIDDKIEISYKLTYSTNVFIYEIDDTYWMTLNPQNLYNKFGNNIQFKRYNKFYQKLILRRNGYEFIPDNHELYKVPIYCDEGLDILKKWLDRYTKLIQSIQANNLIIEMSAGIDTRVLSYFWRNSGNNYTVYTKNRITEYDYATKIISYINDNFNVNLNIISNFDKEYLEKNNIYINDEIIKLNGSNIIHGLEHETSLYDFENIINNPLSNQKKYYHINKNIVPYYDKEYLKIKLNYPGQLKIILFNVLCEEKSLNKLPIISFEQKRLDINIYDEHDLIYKIKKYILK